MLQDSHASSVREHTVSAEDRMSSSEGVAKHANTRQQQTLTQQHHQNRHHQNRRDEAFNASIGHVALRLQTALPPHSQQQQQRWWQLAAF
jgi:hypothetical protein